MDALDIPAVAVPTRAPPRRRFTPRVPDRSGEGRARHLSPLSIAMLAPPWIPVPSPGYGGVESVVSTLTDALVRRGHDVVLFAAPGSVSTATVAPLLERAHPEEIERALYEADHVSQAFDRIDGAERARRFDVIHDHCGFTALAMANRIATPLLHTLHGPFTPETGPFYAEHGHKGTLVAISRAQLAGAPTGLVSSGPIPNPIDLQRWSSRERKGDYVLWIGRITPEKGPHRAIAAARAVDVPIILAGVIQPGQQAFFDAEIAPHIDGERVRFIGEVGGSAKQSLFAHARGLLMPIRWPEPFGMVIVEALASGTPVIAFPEGAAPELIHDGITGFLVPDERGMADAIGHLPRIRSGACRAWVAEHCDADVVAARYELAYRSCAPAQSGPEGGASGV
ncbi:glycosyltransferase family 4 protein [Conexibacter sp. DBS9H8]|uniref:glycosyltransferase family 4 protein n=1 Tax=Conexibacter sp. DBS9H8 TaxID=2937801 RepID=UPI00200ED4B5|nr:glycosyltransferase family 4 protein [Conexibacter sp. DBS9H8]